MTERLAGDTAMRTFSMGATYPPGALEMVRSLIDRLIYKLGWTFDLQGQGGGWMMLRIRLDVPNSLNGEPALFDHTLPIPPVPYSEREWKRWLLDQVLLVEQHEACEHFVIDNARPFYPAHGGDGNPYAIVEV